MPKAHPHLSAMVNQDGAAILDAKTGKIRTLNPSGAYVWQALERGEDLETIAAKLASETGGQLNAVEKDVQEFIDALKEHNLLPC